ncbi:MAG: hypothetical protein IIA73_02335 [Proteobacteria bacterium]|nr:hypothetical protein [Pseudomonadota bacterium]
MIVPPVPSHRDLAGRKVVDDPVAAPSRRRYGRERQRRRRRGELNTGSDNSMGDQGYV